MRKLFLLMAVALVAASCSFFDTTPDSPANTSQTSDNGSGNGSGEGTDTSVKYSDALQGWRCVTYSQNKKTFDQTLTFHYDEKGRIDYYLEHTLSYNSDGVTTWSDDNYKRIYNYTSPTHADFYNDAVEGHSRTNWYDFDAEGRIIRRYNSDGDPFLYHYNAKGELIEIENAYQYEEAEDEQKYGSWKKSRVIEWFTDFSCPHYFYQKWTSGSRTVIRNKYTILINQAYTNPFRGMAIDPTVQEMTTMLGTGGVGLFDLEGWWGKRSEYLVRSWYNEESPEYRVVVTLKTDKDAHITGMTREIHNGGLDTRREYTFTWKGEAPLLKQDGIPVIN